MGLSELFIDMRLVRHTVQALLDKYTMLITPPYDIFYKGLYILISLLNTIINHIHVHLLQNY